MAEGLEEYPEHAKMAARRDELDIIGAFLEWLSHEAELTVASVDYESREIERTYGIETLLAMYTGIDRDKLAKEKDRMFRKLRDAQPKTIDQQWRDVLKGPHK